MSWSLIVGGANVTGFVHNGARFREIASSTDGNATFTLNGAHAACVPGAGVTLASGDTLIWEGTIDSSNAQYDNSGNVVATMVHAVPLAAQLDLAGALSVTQPTDVATVAQALADLTGFPWAGPAEYGIAVGALNISHVGTALTTAATIVRSTWGVRNGALVFNASENITPTPIPASLSGVATAASQVVVRGGLDAITRQPLQGLFIPPGSPTGPVYQTTHASVADSPTLAVLGAAIAERYDQNAQSGSVLLPYTVPIIRAGDFVIDLNEVIAVVHEVVYTLTGGQCTPTITFGFPALSISPVYSAELHDLSVQSPVARLHDGYVVQGGDLTASGLSVSLDTLVAVVNGTSAVVNPDVFNLAPNSTVRINATPAAYVVTDDLTTPAPGSAIALWQVSTNASGVIGQVDLRTHGSIGVANFQSAAYAAPTITSPSASAVAAVDGVTTDVTISATFTNIPAENTASQIAWYFRTAGTSLWSFWAAEVLPGLPNPAASQTLSFLFAGLQNGGDYDFGAAYVGIRGDAGPISVVESAFATGPLNIPAGDGPPMPSSVKTNGPTVTASSLGSAVGLGSGSYAQPFSVTVGDWTAGANPTWFEELLFFKRQHGDTNAIPVGTISANTTGLTYASTADLPASNLGWDIGVAYLDAAGQTSAIVWPAALNAADAPMNPIYILPGGAAAPAPAISGTPTITPTGVVVGLTDSCALSFALSNQPTDSSLTRIALWLRATGASAWTPYAQVAPVSGGSYALDMTDLTSGIGYDFGVSYVGLGGSESPVTLIGSASATALALKTTYLAQGSGAAPTLSGAAAFSSTASVSGITSDVTVTFTTNNQPVDGSLSGLAVYFGTSGGTLGLYAVIPPTGGAYSFTFPALNDGATYAFGIAYVSTNQTAGTELSLGTYAVPAVAIPPGAIGTGTYAAPTTSSAATDTVEGATSAACDVIVTAPFNNVPASPANGIRWFFRASGTTAWGVSGDTALSATTFKFSGLVNGGTYDFGAAYVGIRHDDVGAITELLASVLASPLTVPVGSFPKMPAGATITVSAVTETLFESGMHTAFAGGPIGLAPVLEVDFTLGDANTPPATTWGLQFVGYIRQTGTTAYARVPQGHVNAASLTNASAQAVRFHLTPGEAYDGAVALADGQGNETPAVALFTNYAVAKVGRGDPIGPIIAPGHLYGGSDTSLTTPITFQHIQDYPTGNRYAVSDIDAARKALIDFTQSGHIGKELTNIADDGTYAKTVASHVVGGVAYNYKGVWVSTTAYVQGDEVVYGDSYWLALAGSTGSAPATGNANWQVVGTYSGFDGAWVSTTAYPAGAEVTYSDNFWVCVTANTNSAPTVSNANWQIAGPTSLDAVPDGTLRGAVLNTVLTGNIPDLSKGILNKVAGNITYTGGATVDSLMPAEAGAVTIAAAELAGAAGAHTVTRLNDGTNIRDAAALAANMDASGNSLLVEFPGGVIGKDGALTNVDSVSSTQAYPLPAGTTVQVEARIAAGVAGGQAQIFVGNRTNGYFFQYGPDGSQGVTLAKYVAGVASGIGGFVAENADTNYHTFLLTISVISSTEVQIQGTWDGVDPNAGVIVTDTSLDLTTGLWPITLYTGGSTGKVLGLHLSTGASHWLALPISARTALNPAGQVIGSVYDGTTALTPGNFTTAIDTSGNVKNLDGTAAAAITPIATLMPAEAGAVTIAAAELAGAAGAHTVTRLNDGTNIRDAAALAANMDASGNSLLVEFPGGVIGTDGALTNVNLATSSASFDAVAGDIISVEAMIAKGAATGDSGIAIGSTTNIWSASSQYELKWQGDNNVILYWAKSNGTYGPVWIGPVVTSDTNYHYFRLVITTSAGNTVVEAQFDGASSGVLSDSNLSAWTGTTCCGTQTAGPSGKVKGAHYYRGATPYSTLHPSVRTALNPAGQVVGSVYDGTTALTPANLTNAVDTSGNVKNLGGTAAASITPIATLMPAEAGADVTSTHTANDTTNVNGVAAASISPIATLMPAEAGADVTSTHTANDTTNVSGVAAATVAGGAGRANAAINASNQVTADITDGTTALTPANLTNAVDTSGNVKNLDGTAAAAITPIATLMPAEAGAVTIAAAELAGAAGAHTVTRLNDGTNIRDAAALAANMDASGNSLLVEFPGGVIGKDGALTNVDSVSSTQAYPLPAGTTVQVEARIAAGVAGGQAQIFVGNRTNGYFFQYGPDGSQGVTLAKYVAGVASGIGGFVAENADTNYHTFLLTISVISSTEVQIQGTWDGVDPNAGVIVTDTSLDLTTGLWPITLYTGGSTGKVLGLHLSTGASHWLALPISARTALNPAGQVIGSVYDGTTALTPGNFTTAIDTSGNVKNLDGTAAAAITPIATLMPAEAGAVTIAAAELAGAAGAHTVTRLNDGTNIRDAAALAANMDASGNSLLVEFPGGVIGTDGALTNVNLATSSASFDAVAGDIISVEAMIAKGAATGDSGIAIGSTTNIWSASSQYELKWQGDNNVILYWAKSNGTYGPVWIGPVVTSDTNYHYFRLVITTSAGNTVVEAQFDGASSGVLSDSNLSAWTGTTCCGTQTAGPSGKVKGAHYYRGATPYSTLHPSVRTALNPAGQVVGDVYDGTTALTPANLTTAVDTSGNVKNLGGTAAASITPIATLMPAEAGADVTSTHTANDTANVNAVAAANLSSNVLGNFLTLTLDAATSLWSMPTIHDIYPSTQEYFQPPAAAYSIFRLRMAFKGGTNGDGIGFAIFTDSGSSNTFANGYHVAMGVTAGKLVITKRVSGTDTDVTTMIVAPPFDANWHTLEVVINHVNIGTQVFSAYVDTILCSTFTDSSGMYYTGYCGPCTLWSNPAYIDPCSFEIVTAAIPHASSSPETQTAIDLAGRVIGSVYDGTTALTPLNLTTAIDTSGNVKNLGGTAAASITPIATLMPAEAGADVTSTHTAADTTNVSGVASTTYANRNPLHVSCAGQLPYVDASNVLHFPSNVFMLRPTGGAANWCRVMAGTTVSVATTNGYGSIFVLWASSADATSIIAVDFDASGAAGTGYIATAQSPLYELIGGYNADANPYRFSPVFDNGNTAAASFDVIGDNQDGTGNYHAGKARAGTSVPRANTDASLTGAINASGQVVGDVYDGTTALTPANLTSTILPTAPSDGSFLQGNTVGNRHILSSAVGGVQMAPAIYNTDLTNVNDGATTWDLNGTSEPANTVLANGDTYTYNTGAAASAGGSVTQITYDLPASSSVTLQFSHLKFLSGGSGAPSVFFTGTVASGSISEETTPVSGASTCSVIVNSFEVPRLTNGATVALSDATQEGPSATYPIALDITSINCPTDSYGNTSSLSVNLLNPSGTVVASWTGVTTTGSLSYAPGTAGPIGTYTWDVWAVPAPVGTMPANTSSSMDCTFSGTVSYWTTTGGSGSTYVLAADGVTQRTSTSDGNIQFIQLSPNTLAFKVYNSDTAQLAFQIAVAVQGV